MAAAGAGLKTALFTDVDADAGGPGAPAAGQPKKDVLDIEDAMDRLGGIGRFQLIHFASCGMFWFWQPGVLFSVFANGPCRGGEAQCSVPAGDTFVPAGSGPCCSEWSPASLAAGDAGCVTDGDGLGFCRAEPAPEWWSDCRSVSCQFELFSESGAFESRELLDSAFFAGWMWSVPVWGGLSDRYGRRTALFLALTALHIGQFTSALAPNFWVYLVARHFVGIGVGCASLTSFVVGTEFAPRSSATALKAGWSYWSGIGGILQSLFAKLLFEHLPGYNWRLLTLIMSAPLFVWTFFAFFLISESPRWLLVNRGVAAANACLARVAAKNGTTAQLSTFVLRLPGTDGAADKLDSAEGADSAGASAGAAGGGGAGPTTKNDGYRTLFCGAAVVRTRVVVALTLWFAIAFSYYGLILRSVSLPFDVFYANAIGTTVELPAMLVNIIAIDIFGRKRTALSLYLALAVGSFAVLLWSSDAGVTTLNFFGRAASSAGFSAVYLWSSEIFPTSLRHSAMGLGSMSARVGSLIAPYAARIGEAMTFLPASFAADVPLLLFGSSAIVAGLLGVVFLPETLGLPTPETVADVVGRAAKPLAPLVLSPAAAAKKVAATAIFGLVVVTAATVVVGILFGSALGSATAGIIAALIVGVGGGGVLAWHVTPSGGGAGSAR
eukprot:SAG22_NODE_961_length_6285_cov_20.669091_3_plen_666_part_00